MKNKNNVPGLKLELKVLSILEEAIRSYDLLPSDNHHLNRYLKTRDFFRQYLLIRNMRDDLSTDVYIKKMKEFFLSEQRIFKRENLKIKNFWLCEYFKNKVFLAPNFKNQEFLERIF